MNIIKWLSISDRYTKMYLDKKLAPLGINSSHHMYIVRICEQPGISLKDFMNLFYINPSNITRAISYLEKHEFIKKVPSSEDKRVWNLYPTEKSKSICPEIIKIYDELYSIVLNDFSQNEKEMFNAFLKKTGEKLIDILQDV